MYLRHWINHNGFDLFVARWNCQTARLTHNPDDLGFIFLSPWGRQEAIFVTGRAVSQQVLAHYTTRSMQMFLHQHHDGILFANSYMSLDNELVPQQHAMVCLDQTWWTRLTQDRNMMGERLAKQLHFDVPAKGIHGAVTIAWVDRLMTWQEAQNLVGDLQRTNMCQ